jgi:hypothetical protein
VHELFAEQAVRRPYAVAAEFGDRSLSYAQLDARANAIARRLRGLGVRRGDRVGVCVERSFVMPAAMLGILKTGAAYVPLDPGYPAERLLLTIGDARLAAAVTQPRLMARLEDAFAGGPDVLTVDDDDEPERNGTEELPDAGVCRFPCWCWCWFWRWWRFGLFLLRCRGVVCAGGSFRAACDRHVAAVRTLTCAGPVCSFARAPWLGPESDLQVLAAGL